MDVTFFNDDKEETIVSCVISDVPKIGDHLRLSVDSKIINCQAIRIVRNIGNITSQFDASIQRAEEHVEVWVELK